MGRKTHITPTREVTPMHDTPQSDDSDPALDHAFRRRRMQRLAQRTDPADPASGTARVSARLARARAEALTPPRVAEEIIDLT
jgi:hypothetical protein